MENIKQEETLSKAKNFRKFRLEVKWNDNVVSRTLKRTGRSQPLPHDLSLSSWERSSEQGWEGHGNEVGGKVPLSSIPTLMMIHLDRSDQNVTGHFTKCCSHCLVFRTSSCSESPVRTRGCLIRVSQKKKKKDYIEHLSFERKHNKISAVFFLELPLRGNQCGNVVTAIFQSLVPNNIKGGSFLPITSVPKRSFGAKWSHEDGVIGFKTTGCSI